MYLANRHMRYYDQSFYPETYSPLYIASNPTLLSTQNYPGTKNLICDALQKNHIPAIPSPLGKKYILAGGTKIVGIAEIVLYHSGNVMWSM